MDNYSKIAFSVVGIVIAFLAHKIHQLTKISDMYAKLVDDGDRDTWKAIDEINATLFSIMEKDNT